MTLKKSYISLLFTILITFILMWGWQSWVEYTVDLYFDSHPEYEPHKFMATLQVLLCILFFIINFILTIVFFRSKLFGWGVWLILSVFVVAQPYFNVFSMAADVPGFYSWVDSPFIVLMTLQIIIAFSVRYLYLKSIKSTISMTE